MNFENTISGWQVNLSNFLSATTFVVKKLPENHPASRVEQNSEQQSPFTPGTNVAVICLEEDSSDTYG